MFLVEAEIKGDEGAGYLINSLGVLQGTPILFGCIGKKNIFLLSALMLQRYYKTTHKSLGSGLSRAIYACLRTGTIFHNKQDNASRLSVGLSQPKDSLTSSKCVAGGTFHRK